MLLLLLIMMTIRLKPTTVALVIPLLVSLPLHTSYIPTTKDFFPLVSRNFGPGGFKN